MASTVITLPQLVYDNQIILYVPSTLVITPANGGERSVVSATGGAGVSETVTSVDGTTLVGKMVFSLFATIANIKLAAKWKQDFNDGILRSARVTASADDDFLSRTLNNVILTNNYEENYTPDGEIALEFMCDVVV